MIGRRMMVDQRMLRESVWTVAHFFGAARRGFDSLEPAGAMTPATFTINGVTRTVSRFFWSSVGSSFLKINANVAGNIEMRIIKQADGSSRSLTFTYSGTTGEYSTATNIYSWLDTGDYDIYIES